MTPFLPVLTLFLAFLSTGSSLHCRECISTNSGFCRGDLHKCPPRSTSCIKMLEITTFDDKVKKSFKRACNDDEHLCDQNFMMNSGKGNNQVNIITSCCTKDNCNMCKAKARPFNETLNSYLCPVCFKFDSYDCKSKGYIQCRGQENECIDFAGTFAKKDNTQLKFAFQGCVTPGGCSLGPKILPTAKLIESKRLSCKEAAPITH